MIGLEKKLLQVSVKRNLMELRNAPTDYMCAQYRW